MMKAPASRECLISWALLAPAIIFYGLFVLLPIAQSAAYSLFDWSGVGAEKMFISLENYAWLCRDPVFWRALRNNFLLVLLSLVIQLPAAMGLAVLLSYLRRTRSLFRTILFAPMMLPAVAVGLLWSFIYLPGDGLLDRFLALFSNHVAFGWLGRSDMVLPAVIAAICWRHTGFHMVLFIAGIESIPEELYEAARLDGASEWQVFRRITLPMLLPVTRVSAVLSIVGSLKYFDLIWVMTRGGPAHASELVATYVYKTGIEAQEFGRGSALAVALLAIVFTATLVTHALLRAWARLTAEGKA